MAKKHTIGSTFTTTLRGVTATFSAIAELAEGGETLARTLSGMAERNEKSVVIAGNIALAESLKELADRAKEAKLSNKDMERLQALGLNMD